MAALNKKSFLIYSGVILLGLILINLISRNWFFRLDLTDNKMYSLSESSKSVVKKVDDLLTMKIYFSNDLPGEYGNNRRYLQDILEEYAAFSNGNIRFEFYEPETNEDLEKDAQKSGIRPVQLQVIENDKMEIKKVFMGMVFIYEDQREVIPIIQTTTGLEYEITTKIKKLVDTEKKSIAIAQADDQKVETTNIHNLLNQQYQIQNIDLNNPISDNIDVILISGVKDSLSKEVRSNLEEYISRGGNVLLAQNRVDTDLQTQRATPIESDIFDLLDNYGLHIANNLVLDQVCGMVNVQQSRGFFRMMVPMKYPLLPIIQNFNDKETIVSGLEQVRLIFPSEIVLSDTIPANANYSVTPLLFSSNHSGTMEGNFNLNPDPQTNQSFRKLNESRKVLAARAEIQSPETGAISQIILIPDSDFLSDDGGGGMPDNQVFILNAVDYLMGDSELIALRSREITSRPLEEVSDDAKARWKWVNILLPSLLVVGFGVLRLRGESKRAKVLEEIYD